ncbi:MAG TPA: TolC family protein [Anaeromyxobacteraceae bacterium]|nr:TolC family protein [Anaeromyxobacteraceae bacterium]
MTRALALALLLLPAAALAAGEPAADPAAAAPAAGAEPLTLERAVEIALAHQPQRAAARARTRAARARVGQAAAGLLPQASATAGLGRSHAPEPVGTANSVSLGLQASQLLFDFGQTWNRTGAASASADAATQDERTTLQSAVLAVRAAWFNAGAARDLVEVARETLANREAHLAQVKGFVEVGTRPEIDLAQARADRASAVVQLIGAENDLATARAQLDQAMGLDAPSDAPLSAEPYPAVPGEEGTVEELLAEALRARPEVASLERQRAAQQATLRSVEGQYGPTLAASGKVGEAGTAVDDLSRSWSYGLTLTWPLFEGGRTRAQVEEARATLDGFDAQETTLRQQIRLELTQARLAVRAARASLEATGELVSSARERLRLAEGRYQSGLGSGIELNDAQVALTTAEAQEVKARFTLASARAQLATSLGRV